MKKYIVPVLLMLAFMGQSCSNWLDIKPSDRVTEENAFSTLQGFKQALNGVYVELNQNTLYGRALSCEFIEILAQRYDISSESINNYDLQQFNYAGASNRGRIENIWGAAYNLIANTNLILKNCEERRDVLPDDYYKLIKGETLALRSLLHFDLFRLFGPIYDKEASQAAIPYYTEFTLDVNPKLSAGKFMEQVIQDLEDAAELLADDPIITYGPNGDPSDAFKSFRMLRLNYYAVEGLLARAYLWAQENEKALAAAKKVIAVQETWYPWIKPEDVTRDKIFSTEVLFALQNLNRESLFSGLFNGELLSYKEVLIPKDEVIDWNYEEYDYRRISSLQNPVIYGSSTYRVFSKYMGKDSLMYQMIPMIRMSEVYYIAAETAEDKESATMYITEVLKHRGADTDGEEMDEYLLRDEYYREFFGEGQLFFFYKRKKKEAIAGSVSGGTDVKVSLSSYTLPIPDGENKYN